MSTKQKIALPAKQWATIANSLRDLDGKRISKEEIQFFDFSAEMKWEIALNATIIDPVIESLEKQIRKTLEEHNLKQGDKVTDKNMADYTAAMEAQQALKDQPIELEVYQFSKETLLKKGVLASTLINLMPLIKEGGAA